MDQYVEIRRGARYKEEESVSEKLRALRKQMKNLQVTRGRKSLDYEDLCIHPDLDMPTGYNPPKFEIFDGIGDLYSDLRAYCDKLIGVGRNNKMKMKLFIRNLTGEALTWYTLQDPRNWRTWKDMAEDFMNRFQFNIEITPDRFALVNLQKKSSESFQEYEGIYFEKMIGMMWQKFLKLVKMGDFLEEGIKFGKVQSMAAIQEASKAIQSGSTGSGMKKKEEVSAIVPYYQSNPHHGNTS
ncbi:uncharacterized protein LOC142177100 [Nicotiana tabacum]|uniref:Uncharacterized protein LOC142177100 n=1 Tax=Nicotiana tabacum TaxID=4097 RepID=A0AC58TWP6_TOBAC